MKDINYIRFLLTRDHLGRITPDEKAILEECLKESEEARDLQREIQAIPVQDLLQFGNEMDVEEKLGKVLEAGKAKRIGGRLKWAIGTAAAAVITWGIISYTLNSSDAGSSVGPVQAGKNDANAVTLVLAGGQVINLNDSGTQQIAIGNTSINNTNRRLKFDAVAGNGTEGWNTLTVPKKLDYQLELSDGTTVWLNSATKFRFPFTFPGTSREVFIDAGEAYFKVANNASQPFIVHTGKGDVQVLGTEFNVNLYNDNQFVTSLVSGKVVIRAGIDKKELAPGAEAIVEAGQAITTQVFDPAISMSWRQGLHYFNDAPVTAVAEMLERWFDTPVIIDNPKVGRMQLRGRLYRHKPLQIFIDQMNLTRDVTFYWKDGKLHCK